jgi:hypothetical protein
MDEAAKIIYKYHGGEDNEVAKLEVREVALHVKLSKPQSPGEYIRGLWDYRELFNTHSARWRAGMVTLITLASSLTGNTILTFFQPTMLAAVGVKSVRRKLLLLPLSKDHAMLRSCRSRVRALCLDLQQTIGF